jgi:uncharacterized FlgJ-related protein
MKIAGILLAAALLTPAAVYAQGPGGGRGFGNRATAASIALAHKADLNLTAAQATQIDTLQAQYEAKSTALREKMMGGGQVDFQSMTDEQRQAFREKMQPYMEQMRADRDSLQAHVEKVLKPDQVTKLQGFIQQEMPQRGGGMRPNNN